jgi:hypothetical protein
MARVRSPNYPAFSLPEAISRVQKIHAREQHLAAPREVIAKHLGYGGLNGASNKSISALVKYGLLDEAGNDRLKVSSRALAILYPSKPEEKAEAIKAAAHDPALFAEIDGEWEGQRPSDDNLRSFLIRRNFAADAIDRVIQSYRETMELVARETGAYDSLKPKAKLGDFIQWDQGGVLRLPQPAKVAWVSEDGQWLRVEGSDAGIPMSEIHQAEAPKGGGGGPPLENMIMDMFTPRRTPLSQRMQVTMDGNRLAIQASLFDGSEIDKLIRILNANKDVLDEEAKSATSPTDAE